VKHASRARAVGISTATVLCALGACTTTATVPGYTPITGILIRSSALVEGFGCGTGPHQVFRYVAIVDYMRDGGTAAQASGPSWTNVFDCFADGVFENLPSSSAGSEAFNVLIFAYDKASYEETSLPSNLSCPPGMTADATFCASSPPVLSATDRALAPWVTTCTATQQQGIPVLAVCAPLSDAKTSAEAGAMDAGAPDSPVLDGPAPDSPALDGPAPDGPVLDGPALDGPALDGPALDVSTGADATPGADG
jgi:hypothetical protein